MRYTCIIGLAALILYTNPSYSQNTRTLAGTEFWMTFTENVYTPPDGVLHLLVAPTAADTIRVFNPQLNYSEYFAVKPGQQNNVAVKFNYLWYSPLSFAAQNTGVRITSKRPVQIQAMNRLDGSADGSSILPANLLESAREYVITSIPGASGKEAQAAILAMDTGITYIEILLSADLVSGQGKGSLVQKQLKQGQVFVIQALAGQDLSGTHIQVKNGNCKRISVFSGTKCASLPVPGSCTSCDAIYEQNWPLEYANKEFFVPAIPSNGQSAIQVVALFDNTSVSNNGTLVKVLNKGETEIIPQTGNTLISSDLPVFCSQEMLSNGCNGATISGQGDPSLVTLAGLSQMAFEAVIPAYRNTKYTNYLVVYSETTQVPDIYFNQVLIPSSSFQSSTILGKTIWSATLSLAANNTYMLESETGFIAYTYGMADAESYAMISAASFTNTMSDFIADPGIQCNKTEPIDFKGLGDSLTSISWHFGDGNMANGQNTSHIYNATGFFKVQMVNQRSGVCPDTVSRYIRVIDGPEIQLPADTSLCVGKNYRVTLPTDKAYSYLWDNGSNSFTQTISTDRNAVVTTTDTNGCITSDSVLVKFDNCDAYELKLANVFTPNDDGFNDIWEVKFQGYKNIEVTITNRWGEVMYQYHLPDSEHWNGMVNNKFTACPAGAYFYTLKAFGRDNADNKSANGSIELIR
ncbi:MAG: gliding motility-associated C-terminal domain-containing protein [Bacteroidetes bacterium]|nr:gliding motility-associated C-terminal domain-containing protein [Bacteroidota bacterium]